MPENKKEKYRALFSKNAIDAMDKVELDLLDKLLSGIPCTHVAMHQNTEKQEEESVLPRGWESKLGDQLHLFMLDRNKPLHQDFRVLKKTKEPKPKDIEFKDFLFMLDKHEWGVSAFNTYNQDGDFWYSLVVTEKKPDGKFIKREGLVKQIHFAFMDIRDKIQTQETLK